MPLYGLGERRPRVPPDCWVAPNATLIGDVTLGSQASVWWNAVVRADQAPIEIGARTNIQDGAVLHTDEGVPFVLGMGITVGHQAMLHGCTIGDNCLVGIGAVLLNRCVIGKNSLVGANTLIPEGKTFPEGVLIVGSPGKVVRALTEAEVMMLTFSAQHYVENGQRYAKDLVRLGT